MRTILQRVHRFVAFALALGLLGAPVLAAPLFAAPVETAYPTKPVKVIVAYAAGGVADVMARIISQSLGTELGQSFVVDNRGGAGGVIGTQACATAPPDGYTLCMGSQSSMILAPMLMKAPPYDALKSFSPITLVAYIPNVVVMNPKLGVQTVDGLMQWLKANPGAGWGTSGVGTTNHLVAVYINKEYGTSIEHVPYKGGILAVQDVLAGVIPIAMDQLSSSLPQIRAGTLVPVVQSGATRSPSLPEVPTFAETILPKFRNDSYQGLIGPAGIPEAISNRIATALRKAVETDPVMRAKIVDLGGVPVADTPAEFGRIVADNIPFYREMLQLSGLQPQ